MNAPSNLADVFRFRADLYGSFGRRRDALFELTDAALSVGLVPSMAHLSLEAAHRRGWGSLYAGLRHGEIDCEALRDALASHPLAQGQRVYAVDVSVWPRCDAETSPEARPSTTTPRATPAASPSSPAGPINGSPNSVSSGTAGPRRSTCDASIQPTMFMPRPLSRSKPVLASYDR